VPGAVGFGTVLRSLPTPFLDDRVSCGRPGAWPVSRSASDRGHGVPPRVSRSIRIRPRFLSRTLRAFRDPSAVARLISVKGPKEAPEKPGAAHSGNGRNGANRGHFVGRSCLASSGTPLKSCCAVGLNRSKIARCQLSAHRRFECRARKWKRGESHDARILCRTYA
jgi:hypothetical protein